MNLKSELFTNKKIGIWGFGVVGKSAAKYLVNKFLTQKETPEQMPEDTTQKLQSPQTQNQSSYPVHQYLQLQILDKRELTEQEKAYLENNNIIFVNQSNTENFKKFLENNDLIIPSPGIDLREYRQYAHKFISEFDLFQQELQHIPIIGITGTVGKTTITHMLDQIIKAQNVNIWTGGNIGTPVLDVINQDSCTAQPAELDLVLLELSSFQLELCKTFAPDLAVWTNFFPNHLDKHSDMQEYFMAKLQILTHQTSDQCALLPISLIDKLEPFIDNLHANLYFFSENKPAQELIDKLRPQDTLFYLDNNNVIKLTPCPLANTELIKETGQISTLTTTKPTQESSINSPCPLANTEFTTTNINSPCPFALHAIRSLSVGGSLSKGQKNIGSITKIAQLAEFTFRENLLIIFGSLYIFSKIANRTLALSDASYNNTSYRFALSLTNGKIQINLAKLANFQELNFEKIPALACQVEHRLEKVTSINNIDFYNDSKATTVTSTIAAVEKLASKNKPIILILGGLSKGVDRSSMINEIKKHVKLVISFGKEADIIKDMCDKENVACQSFKNQEQILPDQASLNKAALNNVTKKSRDIPAPLEQALNASFSAASPGNQILFSPSGSSYDLFKDYIERGCKFKELVLKLAKNN